MRRCSLNRLRDLRQRHNKAALFINQRRENQVDVIRHYHCHMQLISAAMIMSTAIQHNIPRPRRHSPPPFRHKRNEMWFGITLQMRQITPVERHCSP
jgi:hypothetical protein